MARAQRICLFGATGSIGESTLDVVASHPEAFEVYAMSAFNQVKKLIELSLKHKPKVLILPTDEAKQKFVSQWPSEIKLPEIRIGSEALVQTAVDSEVDTVVCAIVGTAGLASAYAAAQAGKRILLANKEALVASGQLFMQAVKQSGAELLPIDSEHNAIFQCLPNPIKRAEIKQIILTASGGPFRDTDISLLDAVTPEQACKHPNWSMGRKISVDSATMLNKGLEVIEAKWLFDMPLEQIKVVVHPESVVHSMVHYHDGSMIAQLGHSDMRIPISYALAYPQRVTNQAPEFDLSQLSQLNFRLPDLARYPCLALAYQAMAAGQESTIVLNGSNEVAVEAFLTNQIKFTDIPRLINSMLEQNWSQTVDSIEAVHAFDHEVRVKSAEQLHQYT
ncbi:MAG: 1-deoxy-D-xylulose-5-phosphate reductoisomerase [Alcaligenaceae bacterium]|nr:1-deoxy-D-xylulose-5-phosphate reductoisomerase [Alcaligenaceae bacterium]